jgi:hypothetical protein
MPMRLGDSDLLRGFLGERTCLGQLDSGSPKEELKPIRDGATRDSEIVREVMIYAVMVSQTLVLVGVSLVIQEMLGLLKIPFRNTPESRPSCPGSFRRCGLRWGLSEWPTLLRRSAKARLHSSAPFNENTSRTT